MPFTLDDRLAIRAVALASGSCALEVNVAMNHPAYFEAAEVFVHGRPDVAFVIWRSVSGILLEDIFGNLDASVLGLTMSEVFECLAKLAGVCDVTDELGWTDDKQFEPPHRLH